MKGSINKVIRETRERAGMTQRQLAEAAGFSLSYISDFENGRRAMPEGTLRKLADVLKADADAWVILSGSLPERFRATITEGQAAAILAVLTGRPGKGTARQRDTAKRGGKNG